MMVLGSSVCELKETFWILILMGITKGLFSNAFNIFTKDLFLY
jgi:hypothetical protein